MGHVFADQLVMLAELTVARGRLEDFLDYTAENLRVSRAAPGNIAFEILVDEAQPDKVMFYEVWESIEAQQHYVAWRIGRGDLVRLMSMLAGEPKFTALRSIARA